MILEQLRESLQGAEDEKRKARGRAWAEYRAILERQARPKPTDAARLFELLKMLGLSVEHVELHLIVLAEVDRLQASAAKIEGLRAERTKIDNRISDLRGQIDALSAKIKAEHDRSQSLFDQMMRHDTDAQTLAVLAEQYRGLLSDEDRPLPRPEIAKQGTTAAINDARARLGV